MKYTRFYLKYIFLKQFNFSINGNNISVVGNFHGTPSTSLYAHILKHTTSLYDIWLELFVTPVVRLIVRYLLLQSHPFPQVYKGTEMLYCCRSLHLVAPSSQPLGSWVDLTPRSESFLGWSCSKFQVSSIFPHIISYTLSL